MPVPTPGREREAPSLVLQELSTQARLSASAGLPLGKLHGLRQALRALGHRNFRLFAARQIVSPAGAWMQNAAQAWLAADSYSRRRLVVVTQILSMFQAFAVAALALSGKIQVPQIMALAVVLGTMRRPTFIRPPRDSSWAHLVEGFRYVHGHRAVRTLLAMMAAITLAGTPAVVLMPFFAYAIFHRGSPGTGFLMGTMGAGFCFFAWSNVFHYSLAVMPPIGYSLMRQMASANTSIQTLIPDEFRGRAITAAGIFRMRWPVFQEVR